MLPKLGILPAQSPCPITYRPSGNGVPANARPPLAPLLLDGSICFFHASPTDVNKPSAQVRHSSTITRACAHVHVLFPVMTPGSVASFWHNLMSWPAPWAVTRREPGDCNGWMYQQILPGHGSCRASQLLAGPDTRFLTSICSRSCSAPGLGIPRIYLGPLLPAHCTPSLSKCPSFSESF